MDDRLAGPRRAGMKAARVEARQTRGDAAFRGEAQHHILVEERGIRRERRLPVFAKAPGTRADELVTRDLGEGVAKPGVANSRAREDDVREHLSKISEPVQADQLYLNSGGLDRTEVSMQNSA